MELAPYPFSLKTKKLFPYIQIMNAKAILKLAAHFPFNIFIS